MQNRGCCIRSSVPGEWVSADASWTFNQVNDQLQHWFPRVFAHLDSTRAVSQGQSTQPDWALVVRAANTFMVIAVNKPNGSTLHENKGRNKASIAECELWFGK